MTNIIPVVINNQHIGEIIKTTDEVVFNYQTSNNNDFVSLTMPVRSKSYVNNKLFPIFEMHLPEGYLLAVITKHFAKITDITDDFSLLKLLSNSIYGRVSYQAKNEIKPIVLTDLLHPKSERLFDELVDKFALHSVISGVQPKVVVKVSDDVKNKVTLPCKDYIVKSWGNDYPQLAINEYYSLLIMKYAGVKTPEFYLSDDAKLFINKRFDIADDSEYLGFEDACVLQAKQGSDKYSGSYEQLSKTLKTFISPKYKKQALIDFFKMIVVNNLVQNGDAHLKNFGVLYKDNENIKLAPAYDIVCTTIYLKNDVPALTLGGTKKWASKQMLFDFGKRHCELTTKELYLTYDECILAVNKVGKEIQKRIPNEKNTAIKEFLLGFYQLIFDKDYFELD
jgi:serine/threonine-protein kinase HipA